MFRLWSTSHTTRTCFFRDHSLSLECLCPRLSLPWPIYDSQVAFYQSPEPPCGGHLLANTFNLSLGHCSRLIHLFYQTDGPFFSPFDCLLEKLYFACYAYSQIYMTSPKKSNLFWLWNKYSCAGIQTAMFNTPAHGLHRIVLPQVELYKERWSHKTDGNIIQSVIGTVA